MKDQSRAMVALLVVLAAFAFVATAATGSNAPIIAKPSVQTTTLANDVVPDLASYTDLGAVPASKKMNVAIPLAHDTQAIASYEASLNDPNSSSYEQWVTPAQFQAKFD